MINRLKVSVLMLVVMGLALPFSAKASSNSNLNVEIDGFKNRKGQVCVSIFASSQGFPNNRDRVLQRQCTKITENAVKLTFGNLKLGNYAVAAIHDENNDLKLNRNDIGMPTEGFGFSRNPEVSTSAPKFNDAAFLIAGPNTNIQIQLKYF